MSLWTCPTHGLHGPMPSNVCPTCGAAMSVATVHEAWVPTIDPNVLKEAFRTLDARSASAQSLPAPQRGANAVERALGEEAPTRSLPSDWKARLRANRPDVENAFADWWMRLCQDDANPAGLEKHIALARLAFLAGAWWAL